MNLLSILSLLTLFQTGCIFEDGVYPAEVYMLSQSKIPTKMKVEVEGCRIIHIDFPATSTFKNAKIVSEELDDLGNSIVHIKGVEMSIKVELKVIGSQISLAD